MPSFKDRLSAGRLAAWQLNPAAVKALALVALVIAVVAGIVAWHGRPTLDPVAPLPTVEARAPAAGGGAAASPTTAMIVVAVSGLVVHPGLVTLPAGSRVADAIAAAGGVLPGTDISTLNLARKLTDGELILVGIAAPVGGTGAGGGDSGGGLVNLNTATSEQLQALPGVGPVLADRIIAYRDAHGGFASVEDLRQVSGIGDAKFADLKDLVTV